MLPEEYIDTDGIAIADGFDPLQDSSAVGDRNIAVTTGELTLLTMFAVKLRCGKCGGIWDYKKPLQGKKYVSCSKCHATLKVVKLNRVRT